MKTDYEEEDDEKFKQSVKVHKSLLGFYKEVNLESLPEDERKDIKDIISKEENQLKKLLERRNEKT
jgi:hypothetical protein